ncbi:MAG: YbaK/EbsC family protein [Boseongicola sp.]
MSKSLNRVKTALADAGIAAEILEMPSETRTAADAARAANCQIDQIAKSIIFRGEESNRLFLFITSGGRQVSIEKSSALVGETLGRADADYVRKVTGFAIGGVAPIAHLTAPSAFWDCRLSKFDTIFAAAGTPNHIFAVNPADLQNISGAQPADFTTE